MDPKLAQELEEFKKKKEDVFKNIHLLNNLSETLVTSITEEEAKIIQKKNKEIIESEKKKTANELELLGLENSKMESYLAILAKKQELEMRYLEQMCDQHARIYKLGEKYSYLDVNEFMSYDTHYQQQLVTTKKAVQKQKSHLKKDTMLSDDTEHPQKEPATEKATPPPPPKTDNNSTPQNNPSPPPAHHSKLPFPPVIDESASTPRGNSAPSTVDKEPPSPEPPPSRPQPRPPPPPQRRSTVHSAEGISSRSPPPRRMSLQDQLKFALSEKFSRAVKTAEKDGYASSDSDTDSTKKWM